MAGLSELYSGTETVGVTEWSLTTDTAGPDADTTDGVMQCVIDLANMAAGDQYQIRLYEKISSGGTQRLVEEWIVDGAQARPLWLSPMVSLMHGWDFTLKKVAGTDRSIDWSIRRSGIDPDVATILAAVDTEVAAIKAKTDNLPTDPADASDVAAAFGTVNSTLGAIAGYIDTEVGAIKAKTDNLPATPAAVGDIPTANQNADALLDRAAGVEVGRTLRQALRLILAVMTGKATGMNAPGTAIFRDSADAKDRVTMTLDSNGARTAVATDASD